MAVGNKTNAENPATVPERRAFTGARQGASRDRDAARYSLAEELARTSALTVQAEEGFLVVPPATLPRAQDVVENANELIDGIGPEQLMTIRKPKGGFLAQGFLSPEAFELDSPYLRFALGEDVVAPVSAYLGVVPILHRIDVWYSAHAPDAPRSSQLWHIDPADTTQVKVWVHCSDIDRDSGPLTVLNARTSEELADRIGYNFETGYHVPDERVREAAGTHGLTAFEGPRGTVDFVDTSRCFHFGSRVAENGTPRRVFVAQFLTPYAFKYSADHRDEAPFRSLASDASSDLERLLLGAA